MSEIKKVISRILIIVIATIYLCPNSDCKNPVEFSEVYVGMLADDLDSRNISIRSADLLGDKKDCIIIKSDSTFSILKFNEEKWESAFNIVIERDKPNIKAWTTGDLDNDNKDEIIVFQGKNIILYDLEDSGFIQSIHDFPYYVESAVVGDIDNDKLNELILFCCDEQANYDRRGCNYNLCVVKYDEQKINISWSDNQELGLEATDVVMPDKLVCIADIENNGSNQLVIAGGQSDVSPTIYIIFNWANGGLEKTKVFRIMKGSIITPDNVKYKPRRRGKRGEKVEREEIRPFLIGDFKPALIDGKTVSLGTFMNNGGRMIPVAFEFKDEAIIIDSLTYIKAPAIMGWYPLNEMFWANIDGNDQGILRIIKRHDSSIAYFEYYR